MMNAVYSSVNLRQMGLAMPMLAPLGWSNAAVAAPVYGQPGAEQLVRPHA